MSSISEPIQAPECFRFFNLFLSYTSLLIEAKNNISHTETLISIGFNIVELNKFPTRPTTNSITATNRVALTHIVNKYFTGLRLAICFSLKSLEIFSNVLPNFVTIVSSIYKKTDLVVSNLKQLLRLHS